MKAEDIIAYARDIRDTLQTNDPFIIAKYFGIAFVPCNTKVHNFTAHTLKMPGYPTVIAINDSFSQPSQNILCAHELGHALLHDDCVNHFGSTNANVMTDVEFEANLFALALLSDTDIEKELAIPMKDMNNYLLKTILDYNICINES